MKIVLSSLILLALTGCSTLQVPPKVPTETKVAVTVAPTASTHEFVPQALPVDSLKVTDATHYDVIADAYDQSIVISKSNTKACMVELEGYKKAPVGAAPAVTTPAPAAATVKPPL